MLLENNKQDYIADQQEDTRRMSISSDVESHIIKILTEHSYDDALGSSIREAVSNAVDSVTEAGTNAPVIVKIAKNSAGKNELIIEDKGLGLDDVAFYKYIMGLGESTKRNSATLLGGYGAGAKAWLAYTNNFSYVCRKDGTERKFLIFKGEEYPECTMLYEKATTEPNGVQVIVTLKDNYNELSTCQQKIKEQLCYLDNVYYDISGFQNKYTVYRTKDFQFSDLSISHEMHISLKNICYSIDWSKLGLQRIPVAVALRFDDYSEIKPIFNRESIQYTAASIKAIKDKIALVADYFAEKWNENVFEELSNIRDNVRAILIKEKFVTLHTKNFQIDSLLNYTLIPLKSYTVKNVSIVNPVFYAEIKDKMTDCFKVVAEDRNDKWIQKNPSSWGFHQTLKGISINTYKQIVFIDFPLVGNVKEYLRKKYQSKSQVFFTMMNKKHYKLGIKTNHWSNDNEKLYHVLNLSRYPKDKWRDIVQEYFTQVQEYYKAFPNECNVHNDPDYIEFVKQKAIAQKESRAKNAKVSVALNKEQGEVTIFRARKSQRGREIVFNKEKIKVADLAKVGMQVVYLSNKEEYAKHYWYDLISCPKITIIKLNPTEIKYVKHLKNLVTIEEFMSTKPFARIATLFYIEDLLKSSPEKNMVYSSLRDMNDIKQRLKDYKNKEYFYADDETRLAVIEEATKNNNFDTSIMTDVIKYEKFIKSVGFLNLIKDLDRLVGLEKKIAENMVYILLKHNKITGETIENFDLVPKPVTTLPENSTEEVEMEDDDTFPEDDIDDDTAAIMAGLSTEYEEEPI